MTGPWARIDDMDQPMKHLVDPDSVQIEERDLARWFLFFIESHGADVVLTDKDAVQVCLDPMFGLDDVTARRLAPVVILLIPAMREILKTRRLEAAVH